jgi:hypothetical protein
MPDGHTQTKENRQPVCVGDNVIFGTIYTGGVTAPLQVYSGSVTDSKLTSSVLSQSTQLSVIKSTADSG